MNDDKDNNDDQHKGMPILIIKGHEAKIKLARVVPKKGADPYAINRLNQDIEQFGYNKVILHNDQ